MSDALDTLYHGMLHMPRRRRRQTPPPPNSPFASAKDSLLTISVTADLRSLSTCAKEIYTIGSEVLSVAEQFRLPSERQHWAASADGVFGQVKIEDADEWQGPIMKARVRCWTAIVGDTWEDVLKDKRYFDGWLDSDEAEVARNVLAVGAF